MRISPYLKKIFQEAILYSFGSVRVTLFGSRVDDAKRGGDFDLALKGEFSTEEFKRAKIQFVKYLLKRDLDLPIDLIDYNRVGSLLQSEIDLKGEILFSPTN
jgi:predicted nucleotidyltransferase